MLEQISTDVAYASPDPRYVSGPWFRGVRGMGILAGEICVKTDAAGVFYIPFEMGRNEFTERPVMTITPFCCPAVYFGVTTFKPRARVQAYYFPGLGGGHTRKRSLM